MALQNVECSLVKSVMSPALGLHEGNFGLHPIIFLVDEKSTWNPTWQVWLMLGGKALHHVHRGFGCALRVVTSKRLWAIVQGLLYAFIQTMGYYGQLRALA